MNVNPITRLDYPDPDVIRVEDTYYMVSTTMHFMPGCEILQSFDLVHWEHVTYVYETLDHTDAQQLKSGQNIYGQGMWAASLRYHEGRFYICFVANDTRKTYLYTSEKIDGPWKKQLIEGFYHDGSLLFDEDGRNYIVYGNDEIWITELNEDLTAPKKGGLHRLLVSDHKNPELGYEGSHIQKINGYYYIFLVHSLRDRWMRTEACFYSDSLEGEFTGGDVLCDDRGYCGQGVAQGRNSGYAGWKVVCNAVSGFRSSWTDSYSASGYLEGSFSGFWTERTCAGRNRGSQYQTRIYLSAISGK